MIRFITGFLFILVLPSFMVYAQQPEAQSRFNEGNFELEQKNYAQALRIYQEIEETGVLSGALYINMGYASVYLDSLGLAKYYFLKAGSFPEVYTLANEGIRFVNLELSRRSAVLPVLSVNDFYNRLLFQTNVRTGVVIALLLLNGSVILLLISFFGPPAYLFLKWVSYASGGLAVVLLVLSLSLGQMASSYKQAIQLAKEVPLREEPRTDAPIVISSFEGFESRINLRISKNHEGWLFVVLQNGSAGWVPEGTVRML